MSIQSIDRTIRSGQASGFRVVDVVWMLGICTVSLGLASAVAFYVLMVG